MSSKTNRSFFYKQVNTNELAGIVEIHKTSFKDYFFTNLGEKLLYTFYKELLEHNETIAIAAYEKETLCGFIVGTKNNKNIMRDFYYKNVGLITGSIVIQLLKFNKVIWRGLSSRLKAVKTILRLLVLKNTEPHPKNISNNTSDYTRLLSIAVSPKWCGTGISEGMMTFFLDSLKEDKVDAVGLSVKRENKRAISFYRKMQWQIEREEKNSLYFIRTL